MNRRIAIALALCALSLTAACGSGTQVKAVSPGSYTTKEEQAAVDRILAAQKTKPFRYEVRSVGLTYDGTGVIVIAPFAKASDAEFVRQLQDAAGGIPVQVECCPPGPVPAIGTSHPSN